MARKRAPRAAAAMAADESVAGSPAAASPPPSESARRGGGGDDDEARSATSTPMAIRKTKRGSGGGARQSLPASSPVDVQPLARAPPISQSPGNFDAASPIRAIVAPALNDVRLEYTDGSHYTGQVIRDARGELVRHGFGTLVDAVKKKTYEGEFVAGVKHGAGMTRYFAKRQTHRGEYRRGIRQGPGTLSFEGGEFAGEFHLGKFHGQGVMLWADGSRYSGDWEMGAMTGGVKTLANGERHEGAFDKAGRLQGFGVQRFVNGDVLEARFVDGLAHGRGKLQRSSNGATTWGEYARGKPAGLQVTKRAQSTLCVVDGWGARETERFCELGTFEVASGRLQSGSRFNGALCYTAESWEPLTSGIRTELRYDARLVSCARGVDDDDGEVFLVVDYAAQRAVVDLGRGG